MWTRRDEGAYLSPTRLLEMLEFRFGAFEAIACAALELARKDPDDKLPMDVRTAGPRTRSSSSATTCGMRCALRLRGPPSSGEGDSHPGLSPAEAAPTQAADASREVRYLPAGPLDTVSVYGPIARDASVLARIT